jgi:hypothetical protein
MKFNYHNMSRNSAARHCLSLLQQLLAGFLFACLSCSPSEHTQTQQQQHLVEQQRTEREKGEPLLLGAGVWVFIGDCVISRLSYEATTPPWF